MARAYFRRKKGVTSKRQEAPAHGTWWVDYRDAAGSRRQERVPTARTKAEALEYAQRLAQRAWELRKGIAQEAPEALTFTAAASRYREAVRHLASFRQIDYVLTTHIEPEIGRKLLAEVTPEDIDVMAARLRNHLKPSTLQRVLLQGGAVYTWAKRRARIFRGQSPFADASRIVVPRRSPRALTPQQLRAVLSAAGAWRPLFGFAALTGARKGEVCGLRWDDLDLAAGLVHIRRSYGRDTTKGGKERVVPLHPLLVPILEAMQREARSPFVFPARDGTMRTERTFNAQQAFRRACVRAGVVAGWTASCRCGHTETLQSNGRHPCPKCSAPLTPRAIPPPFSFKHLRSTYATLLGDPRAAQELLGHSHIDITAGHYLATSFARLREVVRNLPVESVFSPVSGARPSGTTD